MFLGKSAAPYPVPGVLHQPVLRQAAEGAITLFTAPPGYLLTESLAAILVEYRRPTLWLRLGCEDRDPATFLLSFIAAIQQLCPGAGLTTVERMQREPGAIVGWQVHFAHLASQVAEALPPSTAVVLENVHHLDDMQPTLRLAGLHLLPALPAGTTRILTSHRPLPPAALPINTSHRGVDHLRIDARTALSLVERAHGEFPTSCVQRALALSEGRAVVFVGLIAACARLGPKFIKQAVDRARGTNDLLAGVARAWLATADSETLESLAMAVHLEYSFPALVGRQTVPADPWMQPLVDGWARVRQVWRDALPAALPKRAVLGAETLRRVAQDLSRQEAIEQAVSLYFDLDDMVSAAQVIAGAADRLMNLGQWETLKNWLSRLPASVLQAHPWLVYNSGEIAATQGRPDEARFAFASAGESFMARQDYDGACQSLLAESTIATWQGDHALAHARAQTARAIAEAAHLSWHECWAAWQLGYLAATSGNLDNALDSFSAATEAAATLNEPHLSALLSEAEKLTQKQRELRWQRENHRQAYIAAEYAEYEAAKCLHELFAAPYQNLGSLLGVHGWSRIPLMAKLSASTPTSGIPTAPNWSHWWESLRGVLGLHQRPTSTVSVPARMNLPRPPELLLMTQPSSISSLPPPPPAPLLLYGNVERQFASEAPSSAIEMPVSPDEPVGTKAESTAAAAGSGKVPTFTAYLLGTFRVAVNNTLVENWNSNRGRNLLKYLLTHRERPIPRDVLMEAFWPNAKPEAARNRLNVALHGLRQALKSADDVPVVLFQDEAYCLNPELRFWLDVDEFERHIQLGGQLETEGHSSSATAEYELAIGLYQGDFLADDMYEDWAIATRERLRAAYLDTLDRLSRTYFSQRQYALCAALCQSILDKDDCSEVAHCRLMRCYSRQGQYNLAIRQYQACLEALRNELDVAPAPETTQLYERICQHERV